MEPVIHCPFCRGPMRVLPGSTGTEVTCPHCRQRVTVPALPAAEPPPLPGEVRPKSSNTLVIVLAVVGGAVVVLPMLAGFMLPALAKAQEAARRTACMHNVRNIGVAMTQYAGDHVCGFMDLVDASGTRVPTIGLIPTEPSRTGFILLMKDGYITTPKVFVCPSSRDAVHMGFPNDLKGCTMGEMLAAFGEKNCSYGWDPTKKPSADATCAIAADKPRATAGPEGRPGNNSENHSGEGQNVFYRDGHVKWGTTPRPDSGDDPDIYTGATGYETSNTDAKIIR